MIKVALVELGPTRPELHEPLGIETIAGYLAMHVGRGLKVDLFSLSFAPRDEARLLDGGYTLIGLGAKIGTWHRVQELTRKLATGKGQRPLLVLGDVLGSEAAPEILKALPDAICVRGEGEEGFAGIVQLAMRLLPSSPEFRAQLATVPNLVYLQDGKTVETPFSALDLTAPAPPRRTFLQAAVAARSQAQIEGSRGCPWSRCSFCSIPGFNGVGWRPFPVATVVDQLVCVSEAGVKTAYFTDSDFLGASIARAHQFADQVLAAKQQGRLAPDLTFYLNLQVTGIVGGAGGSSADCTEMLRHLQVAGLREVFVGLESGAREQVQRYAKAATPERNRKALETLRKLGIRSDVGFIMFDPLMAPGEILLNLKFLRDCGLWGHPGRFTKAVRIQPNTVYADTFFGEVKPALNVNNLTYPYQFRNPAVDTIYRNFRKWELDFLDFETLVQGASKGEVTNEETRLEVRSYLGGLRELDLRYLEGTTRSCMEGTLETEGFTRFQQELREEMGNRIKDRPVEVDRHARRLGIDDPTVLLGRAGEAARYKAVNSYEDPVYADISYIWRTNHE